MQAFANHREALEALPFGTDIVFQAETDEQHEAIKATANEIALVRHFKANTFGIGNTRSVMFVSMAGTLRRSTIPTSPLTDAIDHLAVGESLELDEPATQRIRNRITNRANLIKRKFSVRNTTVTRIA